ncbi:hypothetical protein [Clostridium rectalis]|uniref:hypothetical protein n=1 Tax=Clostridium rectalis TaxID=2040295 RepID=UPI000F636B00|nr:hypothetical protein [Clostridium rectalis]
MDTNNENKSLNCTSPSTLLQETSNPLYKVPIFLSYSRPFNDLQTRFLDSIISQTKCNLLFPRTLGRSDQYTETPLTSIRKMVISSYGLLAVSFRRILVKYAVARPNTPDELEFENFWLTSPYLQLEPSMAHQQGLPLMLLVEDGVNTTSNFGGALKQGVAPFNIVRFNLKDDESIESFFNGVFWRETFADWVGQVRSCYNKETQPEFKCSCNC